MEEDTEYHRETLTILSTPQPPTKKLKSEIPVDTQVLAKDHPKPQQITVPKPVALEHTAPVECTRDLPTQLAYPTQGVGVFATERVGCVIDEEGMKKLGCRAKIFDFYSDNGPPEAAYVAFRCHPHENHYKISIFSLRSKKILHDCNIKQMEDINLEGHRITWKIKEKTFILKSYEGYIPDVNYQRRDNVMAKSIFSYIGILKNEKQ